MIEEKKPVTETPAAAPVVSGAVKADATTVVAPVPAAAPVVLSQAPPPASADAKPVVDKPSTVVPSTFDAMK